MYDDGKGLKYESKEKIKFCGISDANDVECRIMVNGGYNVEGALKTAFMDKEKQGQLVRTLIVFDSDATGETDDSGQEKRRLFLTNQADSIIDQLKGSMLPSAQGYSIFLFPDNKMDGDLETLLCMMSKKINKKFFYVCWPIFQWLLKLCRYLQLSNKTLIYDYVEALYLYTNKVAKVKEYQGYNKNLSAEGLWDWNAKCLDPLVEFLSTNVLATP